MSAASHILLLLPPLLAVGDAASSSCSDAPGWTNLDGLCAYKEGGRTPEWCAPRAGSAWPVTAGWTCEHYREQGWCKDGVVSSAGMKEMGAAKNWPERYCCGCAPLPDTSCDSNTGKACSECHSSLGPVECRNSTCKCQSGYCASSAGICSLYQLASAAEATVVSVASAGKCVDTPGWANLWSGCAWQSEGKNKSVCRPTPGAQWPSTSGWTCEYYRAKGLCQNGEVKFASGSLHNYPEMNCCGCAKPAQPTCNVNTGGTCAMMACDSKRGSTKCVNGTCLCTPGHCGTSSGYCSLEVSKEVEQTLIKMYKDVIIRDAVEEHVWEKLASAGHVGQSAIAGLAAAAVLGAAALLVARRASRDKKTFNTVASDEELEEK